MCDYIWTPFWTFILYMTLVFFCNKCIGLKNLNFIISFLIDFLSSIGAFRFIVPYSTQVNLNSYGFSIFHNLEILHLLLSGTTEWLPWIIVRLIPHHMLWTASGCFAAESHSALKFCEFCSVLFWQEKFKIFSQRFLNYNLICSILPDWLVASLPRWLTSLEVIEFCLWYNFFFISLL